MLEWTSKMPWINLFGFIPFKREFTALNLEFTAVNSTRVKNNSFEVQRTITCDSSKFSKAWYDFRAPFNKFLGVYGL